MKQDIPVITTTTPDIRILKIGTCPSLSGISTLTYHVGCDPESAIFFRIHSNSGKGYFSREWVSTDSIGKALAGSPGISSFTLQSAYVGKSQNNGGFMLAAILAEGLVCRSVSTERHYQLGDSANFNAEIKALIESSVSLDADAKTPNADTKPKKAKKAA